MKLGFVGLPNVGKSTLFNAITRQTVEIANYPFTTITPHSGVAAVPDSRLPFLTTLYKPRKVTPAILEVVDIAGLVQGASHGEGLGNAFLADIREVDAIGHVVRCFGDPDVTHVAGSIDPARDMAVIDDELILADIAYLERRLEKTQKMAKGGNKDLLREGAFLQSLLDHLFSGRPARLYEGLSDQAPKDLLLLSAKPVLYIANVGDPDSDDQVLQVVQQRAAAEKAGIVAISARLEAEMNELSREEEGLFRAELGVSQSGLERIILTGYELLGLLSFLTVGPDEVRAWTVRQGTKAPQAAGKIHSDFERGFIRAEVVAFADLQEAGTMIRARELGKVRSEGKEYVIADGDVVLFRFNV